MKSFASSYSGPTVAFLSFSSFFPVLHSLASFIGTVNKQAVIKRYDMGNIINYANINTPE